MSKTTRKCPKCGGDLLEIVYGMPMPELFEAAERGEVVLGGCCISNDDPHCCCKKCKLGYSWNLKKSYDLSNDEEL